MLLFSPLVMYACTTLSLGPLAGGSPRGLSRGTKHEPLPTHLVVLEPRSVVGRLSSSFLLLTAFQVYECVACHTGYRCNMVHR